MAGRMEGRRVIVTGAASGMGRGIAELFAAEGAALALFDRDASKLAEAAKATGGQAHVCDVSDAAAVEASVGRAIGALGGLDGMVNAAGILVTKAFAELTLEDFNRMIGVNLVGPFNMIKAALPALAAAPSATIVNVASASGYFPTPGISGYGATKGGLIMFAKGLALDLGPKIRVNTICPGVIRTEMTRYLWENPEHTQRATDRTALKRLGDTGDIARAALFLSTEDSAYTTGTDLLVDGGFTWR